MIKKSQKFHSSCRVMSFQIIAAGSTILIEDSSDSEPDFESTLKIPVFPNVNEPSLTYDERLYVRTLFSAFMLYRDDMPTTHRNWWVKELRNFLNHVIEMKRRKKNKPRIETEKIENMVTQVEEIVKTAGFDRYGRHSHLNYSNALLDSLSLMIGGVCVLEEVRKELVNDDRRGEKNNAMISYAKKLLEESKLHQGLEGATLLHYLEQEIKSPPVLPDDDDLTICTSQNRKKIKREKRA